MKGKNKMTKKLFKIWSELKTIDDKESILKCFKRRKNKNLYFVFKKIHILNK
jgi:hypothetical protein